MKTLFIIVLGLLLSGCATIRNITSSPPPLDIQGAWVGQPLLSLETHPEFGVPTEHLTLSDGSLAYVYQFNGAVHSSYTAIGSGVISSSSQTQCKFTFYAKESVITGMIWHGRCRIDSSRLPKCTL